MRYSVWPKTRLNKIPANATELHLVRPIGFKQLNKLCQKRCIRRISCSESSAKRLKTKTKRFLEDHGIELTVESKRGRPISIALPKMLSIIEMAKDHRSFREIEKTTSIPKSTAHYLVHYARRTKLRQNNATVFLD